MNKIDNIIINNEPIELKTHDTIYLEIYKKAKQKAKEIRKNAIEAFLEEELIRTRIWNSTQQQVVLSMFRFSSWAKSQLSLN